MGCSFWNAGLVNSNAADADVETGVLTATGSVNVTGVGAAGVETPAPQPTRVKVNNKKSLFIFHLFHQNEPRSPQRSQGKSFSSRLSRT
jgi:hypothetical protein